MNKIEQDSVVWGKYEGYPYWPAVIKKINEKERTCEIHFFGEDLKGIVPLKNVKVWSDDLNIKEKSIILNDKSLSFSYGIALKYLQKEFDFKDHVKYLKGINKKEIISHVQHKTKNELSKEILHQDEIKTKMNEDEVDENKEKCLQKKRRRQSDNDDNNSNNKNRKSYEKIAEKEEKKDSHSSQALTKDKEAFINKDNKEISETMITNLAKMDYDEVNNFLHSLNPIIKKIEASKNIILSKLKKIIKILNDDQTVDKEIIDYVSQSIQKIQGELQETYSTKMDYLIQSHKAFVKSNINDNRNFKLNSKKEQEDSEKEESKSIHKKQIENHQQQENQSNDENKSNAEEEIIKQSNSLTNEDLSLPPQYLQTVLQLKKNIQEDLTPPNLLKYKPIYSFFKVISYELNEPNLTNFLCSIKQFNDQIIKGSFIFQNINTNDSMKINTDYRQKTRQKIQGVLQQIFNYLEITISSTFINNMSQFFEMKSAKIDPTITYKYNDFITHLFQTFKTELVLKPKITTTMLK